MKHLIGFLVWLRTAPQETIGTRVVHATVWSTALRILERSFGLIRTIVLARLLAPDDFGLMGIAALVIAALQTATQTGFASALIQRRQEVHSYLNTLWTVETIRGLAMGLVMLAAAGPAASFFDASEAAWVVRALAVAMVLDGVRNPAVVRFHRHLEFRRYFTYQAAGTLADALVSVTMALVLQNVWALVLGVTAGAAARALASYVVDDYRPRLSFDLARARELVGFGRWVFLSGILLYALLYVDDLFVGRMLGVGMLGLYRVIFQISQLPTTELTHVIGEVTFPAFSRMVGEGRHLGQAYLRVLRVVATVTFPVAGILIILGGPVVNVLLGPEWVAGVAALQILAAWGAIRALAATAGPLVLGSGRPSIAAGLQAFRLAVFLPALPFMIGRWGLAGAAGATLVSALVEYPLAVAVICRMVGLSVRAYFRELITPVIGVVALGTVTLGARSILGPEIGLVKLTGLVGLGLSTYVVLVASVEARTPGGLRQALRELLTPVHQPVEERLS